MLTTERMLPPAPLAHDTETVGPSSKSRRIKQEDTTEDTPQHVMLVTEPHTDINVGFVVVLESAHDAPLAQQSVGLPQDQRDSFWKQAAADAVNKNHTFTLEYLIRYSDPSLLSLEEQGEVLQSGLALSPLAWAHTRYTADWTSACLGRDRRMDIQRVVSSA